MDNFAFMLIGLLLGSIIGFFYGRHRSPDLSMQVSMSSLLTQVSEMKAKFIEIEKSRVLVDNEKDKRIKEMNEQYTKFFEDQNKKTEQFLLEQGKSREEIEKKRDAQIADMSRIISDFTQIVSGTKTRGTVGEDLLKNVLSNSIKAEVIKCDLKTGSGEVEFAWNLEDGKYIPIDSKLPELENLIKQYSLSENVNERKKYKKAMLTRVKSEIKRVQKYQNLSNTIRACLLVVPPVVLDIAPELVGIGQEDNVYVCDYKEVFPIAHFLQERYRQTKEKGDIGEYREIIRTLFQVLDKIGKKVFTIDKAVAQIENADKFISEEVKKGKRAKIEMQA